MAGADTEQREDAVKYLLMIFTNPATPWTGSTADYDGLRALYDLEAELAGTGELVNAEGLTLPADARTVRVRDGVPLVTDGPFGEAKEHLAGYFLVDCRDLDRALEIAASMPVAASHAVEVRPLMDKDSVREQLG